MTKSVGIVGGGNLSSIGNGQEVQAFFDVVAKHCCGNLPDDLLSMVTERLYRGSVRPNEFDALEAAWKLVFDELSKVTSLEQDLKPFKSEVALGKIDTTAPNLSAAFLVIFDYLISAINRSRTRIEKYGTSDKVRIRIGHTSVPLCYVTKDMTDDEFDKSSGEPFWLS